MACWFNLPGHNVFSSGLLLVSLGGGRWHHSVFFDVPVSSCFHYLGRTWSREEMGPTSLSQVPAVFPLLCLCHHLFLMPPPLSRSWGHGTAARWPRATFAARATWLWQPEEGQSLSISPGRVLGRGWAGERPQNAQLRPTGRAGGEWGERWARLSHWLKRLAGHVGVSLSSAVLPFCNLWISLKARAWGLSCSEIRPWSQIV